MTGDTGYSDTPICIGRHPSNVTTVGHRPSSCACHDITPRITFGHPPCGFNSCRIPAPARFASNCVFVSNSERDVDIGLPRRFDWLNLTRAGKPKPFSSADEHDEGNLVSERARRIPGRVFKIHERGGPAIGFKRVAVRENAIGIIGTAKVLWYYMQGVGVVQNFGAEIKRTHIGGNIMF